MTEALSTVRVADVAYQFQQLVPERYEADLSDRLKQVLDPSLPVSATLPWLFSVAAFLASNNGLTEKQMDNFLTWIIDQAHAESLARFMEIQTPTVHAFAKVLLESAIRIKNVQVLNTLLNCGVKLDGKLYEIAFIVGDIGLPDASCLAQTQRRLQMPKGGDPFSPFCCHATI